MPCHAFLSLFIFPILLKVRASKSELERVRAESRHAEAHLFSLLNNLQARASAREISNVEAAKVIRRPLWVKMQLFQAAVADDWKKEVERLQVCIRRAW